MGYWFMTSGFIFGVIFGQPKSILLHIYALQPIPLEQLDVVKQNLRWMKVHGIGASLGIFCLIIYSSESQ